MRKITLLLLFICACCNFGYAQLWTVPGTIVAGGNGMGTAANQFNSVSDFLIAANGDLYVSDGPNHRVQKWAVGATEGVTVAGGNGQGAAANQLSFPAGIWLDEQLNVLYVVDAFNARVQKWDLGAAEGTTVAGGNGWGNALNQFSLPNGLFKRGSDLYIYDGNARVIKWTLGATEGTVVAGGNDFGTAANQLAAPQMCGFLYVDASENVYVTEYSGDRVTKWSPGATEGTTVADIAATGSTNVRVSGIAFLDDQTMLLSYSAGSYNSVTLWHNGQYVNDVVTTASNELSAPLVVRLDSAKNLYVADQNRRVLKYAFEEEEVPAQISVATLNNVSTVINVGETVGLVATIFPADLPQAVTWSVQSGSANATVNAQGLVTGIAAGNATVRATSVEDTALFAEIAITVINCSIAVVSTTPYEVCSGSNITLVATASEEGGTVRWYATETSEAILFTGSNYVAEGLTAVTSYWVAVTSADGNCTSERAEIVVTVNEVPTAPVAVATQQFIQGETLADLDVNATGTIQWYADAALTTPLASTTVLVTGTTYYVTQSNDSCQSAATAVTVDSTMSVSGNQISNVIIYPNPTTGMVNLKTVIPVVSVNVYNTIGQLVLTSKTDKVDLYGLTDGLYFLKITLQDGKSQNVKVYKK